jgi:hypothetical protein
MGVYEHWYGNRENPICGRCFASAKWKERFIPEGVKCENCGATLSKYGTPNWVKNKDREGGYLCRSCFTTKRNKGMYFLRIEKQMSKQE